MELNKIHNHDCIEGLRGLPDQSVDCCVTSPPYYGLRDYGVEGQIGLEETPEKYVSRLVEVFREVRRVLRDDGTVWVNLGDSYNGSGKGGNPETSQWKGFVGNKDRENSAKRAKTRIAGLKPKDLIGIPWMVAFALRSDGWYLRQDIIWHKPNPMPESVTDRCTKAHEYIFLLSKSQGYYFDQEAIKEPAVSDFGVGVINAKQKYSDGVGNQAHYGWMGGDGENRNKRSVWTVTTKPFKSAHFATFPPDLIVPCVKAGCPENGIVLDPFMGAGTTAVVARKLNRNYIGFELNEQYIKIANERIYNEIGLFNVLQPAI